MITWPIKKNDMLAEFYLSREQGRVTERLGGMFQLMAEKYATRKNWSGYSYREEMVQNGVLNLMTAWKSFKPEQSQNPNPFGYLTRCLHTSFIRTLFIEKQQQQILTQERIFAGAEDTWYNQSKHME